MTTSMMKEAILALYPPRPSASRRRVRRSSSSVSSASASASAPASSHAKNMSNNATPTPMTSLSTSSYSTHPKRKGHKSRFSELLLEHGEKHLQDWAVCASSSSLSSPSSQDGGGFGNRNNHHNGWNKGNNNGNSMTETIAGTSSSQMKQTEGRLRLCSHSLVFEPKHSSRGIVRIPFRHMMGCPFLLSGGGVGSGVGDMAHDHEHNTYSGGYTSSSMSTKSLTSPSNMTIVLRSERHIVMKENNVIGPFQHVTLPVEFKFTFLHSSPLTMLSLTKQLYESESSTASSSLNSNSSPSKKISFAPNVAFENKKSFSKTSVGAGAMNPFDNNNNAASTPSVLTPQQQKQIQIDNILTPAINRSFDPFNFQHIHEKPMTHNLRCELLTPLLSQRGCVIVTDFHLYFQPIGLGGVADSGGSNGGVGRSTTSSCSSGKAQAWSMEDMRAVARRYDGMKDQALEIYLAKHEGGGSMFGSGNGSGNGNSSSFPSGNEHPVHHPSPSLPTLSSSITVKSSYYSILLSFESTEVRERVLRLVSQRPRSTSFSSPPLPLPCHTDRSFVESALELWQAGQLDNFEYLLVLNSAAGRSFHDLSRYPVFPWVLSNYGNEADEGNDDDDDDESIILDLNDPNSFRDLSKPIGALNDERFQDFHMRYESMVQSQKQQPPSSMAMSHDLQEVPFMYGTHYSSPGYVLYYLLRVMPEHMLCLQSGKFDVPDRLFHSINDSYKSILTNPGDVKELIPEFFDPDCFDFLINSMGLQLGNLQAGDRVNDVVLPPWASSAKDFLRQNRAALESDYCTKYLPRWIDLVFGVTSRGSRAKEAKNLFHPTSYLGPADINAMTNEQQRNQAELQASEFGIIPDQLFCQEHPGKNVDIDNANSGGWQNLEGVIMPDHLRQSYGVADSNVASRMTLKQQLHGASGVSPMGRDDVSSTAGIDLPMFSHSLSVE